MCETVEKYAQERAEEARAEARVEGNAEILQILDSINSGVTSVENLISLGYDKENVIKVLQRVKPLEMS